MTALLIIIVVLFLLFKGFPWLMAWWIRRQHLKYQEQVGQAYEQARRQQQEQERAQQRASHIEDNAEDAEYQEIVGPREAVVQETFTAEEQVIDAEFEEI